MKAIGVHGFWSEGAAEGGHLVTGMLWLKNISILLFEREKTVEDWDKG